MRTLAALALALGLTSGCGGGDGAGGPDAARPDGAPGADSGPAVDAGPDAATGTLTGSFINRFRTSSGLVEEPGFAGQIITVRAPDGTTRSAVVGTDGRFTVDLVPVGDVLVSYAVRNAAGLDTTVGLVTRARTLDLGADFAGWQPSAQAAAGTAAAFTLTGMATWSGAHTLRVLLPNARDGTLALSASSPAGISNFPIDGATALSALTVPWRRPLPQPGRGDSLLLVQRETRAAPGTANGVLTTLVKTYGAPSAQLTDGATTSLTGAFTDVPVVSLPLRLDRAPWDALVSKLGPGAMTAQASVRLSGGPLGATELATLQVPTDEPAISTTLGYGDPFSGPRSVTVSFLGRVSILAPGAATPSGLGSLTMTVTHATSALPAGNLLPRLTPPEAPQRNGAALSWSPPATGTAALYRVTLFEVRNNMGSTDIANTVAQIDTTATSLALPAQLLTAGRSYFASITADDWRNPTAPERAPSALPTASATTMTAQFTP